MRVGRCDTFSHNRAGSPLSTSSTACILAILYARQRDRPSIRAALLVFTTPPTPIMKRISHLLFVACLALVMVAADGCSSDPNVEGAKLDLRNQDYDRALSNIEKALETNPDNSEALKLKGDIYLAQLDDTNDPAMRTQMTRDLVMTYERAAQIDPELQPEVSLQLQRALRQCLRQGNREIQCCPGSQRPRVVQRGGDGIRRRDDHRARYCGHLRQPGVCARPGQSPGRGHSGSRNGDRKRRRRSQYVHLSVVALHRERTTGRCSFATSSAERS